MATVTQHGPGAKPQRRPGAKRERLTLAGPTIPRDTALVPVEEPASSGPGEIYPTIVEVPFVGCWHVELAWGPNTDAVDLIYLPGT